MFSRIKQTARTDTVKTGGQKVSGEQFDEYEDEVDACCGLHCHHIK